MFSRSVVSQLNGGRFVLANRLNTRKWAVENNLIALDCVFIFGFGYGLSRKYDLSSQIKFISNAPYLK